VPPLRRSPMRPTGRAGASGPEIAILSPSTGLARTARCAGNHCKMGVSSDRRVNTALPASKQRCAFMSAWQEDVRHCRLPAATSSRRSKEWCRLQSATGAGGKDSGEHARPWCGRQLRLPAEAQ
jgi:hypothetical protein